MGHLRLLRFLPNSSGAVYVCKGFAWVEGKFTGQDQESGMLQFRFRSRNTVPSSVYRLGLRPLIPQVHNIDEP
jgi:hypothetical protein